MPDCRKIPYPSPRAAGRALVSVRSASLARGRGAPVPGSGRYCPAGAAWRCWTDPGTAGCSSERVEGFAEQEQWTRASEEIAEFERTLNAEGMILVKFWMHVSEDEQLARFESRAQDPLRSWKLTDEDWRNRD